MAAALRGAVVRAAPLQMRRFAAPAVPRNSRPMVAVRSVATKAPEVSSYNIEERGPKESLEYRIAFKQNDKVISCWHEIPLWAGEDELHFICEIPKETSAKMEVATDEPSTPIKQDTKKGKLRFLPPPPPITLSDAALEHLKKLRAESGGDDLLLRMGVKSGGCSGMSYVMDFEKAENIVKGDDMVMEYDGFRLVCDSKSLLYLFGMQLDWSSALVGGGFQFHNPQANSSCGCGKSFGV